MAAPYATPQAALEHERDVTRQFTELVAHTMTRMNAAGVPGTADKLPEMVETLIKERDYHRTWARSQNTALQDVARTLNIKSGQDLIGSVTRRVRKVVKQRDRLLAAASVGTKEPLNPA